MNKIAIVNIHIIFYYLFQLIMILIINVHMRFQELEETVPLFCRFQGIAIGPNVH
jgi:hypothetical protein